LPKKAPAKLLVAPYQFPQAFPSILLASIPEVANKTEVVRRIEVRKMLFTLALSP